MYPGVHRRLDLKVYPVAQFPFALLYFTGSDHFNRSMRFYAKKKHWTLSDHGLAPCVRVSDTHTHTHTHTHTRTSLMYTSHIRVIRVTEDILDRHRVGPLCVEGFGS